MTLQPKMLAAVTAGDLKTVKGLLQLDPGLATACNDGGISVLMTALYHRHEELATFLAGRLEHLSPFEAAALGAADLSGPPPDNPELVFSPDGFSPLHLAVFFAREAATLRLIEQGADVHLVARNPMKVQPLHSAVAGGATACVGAVLDAGADPNARQSAGFTALMAAAGAGRRDLVVLLLTAGADKSLTADDSRKAADFATAAGHEVLAREL